MTNATVADLVSQPSGRVMTLRYKDGEKKVVVPEGIPVVTFAPADASMLKSGAHVFLSAARQPDGALTTARVLVGKDGLPSRRCESAPPTAGKTALSRRSEHGLIPAGQ